MATPHHIPTSALPRHGGIAQVADKVFGLRTGLVLCTVQDDQGGGVLRHGELVCLTDGTVLAYDGWWLSEPGTWTGPLDASMNPPALFARNEANTVHAGWLHAVCNATSLGQRVSSMLGKRLQPGLAPGNPDHATVTAGALLTLAPLDVDFAIAVALAARGVPEDRWR